MRYCLALDLKDDPALIAEYERYHEAVWPDIRQSLYDAGIVTMEIYRVLNRLFLILDADDTFSLERKAQMDADNPRVQAWETLMDQYQARLPGLEPGGKWLLARRVFVLEKP
jgi:L-rhamnose mutarotase